MAWYARYLAKTPPAERPHPGRRIAFFSGWIAIYLVMQTHFDYLSQHMFFIHRIQHLVLHHLGPFLVALALPFPLPPPVEWLAKNRIVSLAWRSMQNWAVAPALFVGLIYFWLTPSIHFDAMLNAPLYAVMNWSMLLDGLLFWSLMLDPRPRRDGALIGFGPRIGLVLLAIPPQIAIGWHIAMSGHELYDVYAVCGRAWGLAAMTDQTIGGLTTWIPAGMMHVVAALILIARWMRFDQGPTRRQACAAS